MKSTPRTMFEKIWDAHVVVAATDSTPAVLYADLHLIHEVTSPQAFEVLRERGLRVRRPGRTLATMDHSTPTQRGPGGLLPILDAEAAGQVSRMRANCREFGVDLADLDSPERGIVHVMGPELGATQPGMTIVCGDSHTSTHGAFGTLAFGIGTSEVAMVLATQCLPQARPRTLAVEVTGALPAGVTAKDLILAVIRELGVGGGAGHVIEYRGSGISALGMEARMTVCNMSIEAGARAGMIAPDETTFEYLRGRPRCPAGEAWDAAVSRWRDLPTDAGARFDRTVSLRAEGLSPMITWGTTPAMSVGVDGSVPADGGDAAMRRSREYMGLAAGQPMRGLPVDVVFIGSCTNSRLSDLRQAAGIMRGRKVARGVRVLVVPGSQAVKRQAEHEGLDRAFVEAGAEWREPGCSMCIAMNGDRVEPGKYAVSTSNRNFEGRQGVGARTLLASPLTAAASAIAGRVEDPRGFDIPGGGR